METKAAISVQYEAPLGYCIEDIRPNGGIQKFRSAAYSDVSPHISSGSEKFINLSRLK